MQRNCGILFLADNEQFSVKHTGISGYLIISTFLRQLRNFHGFITSQISSQFSSNRMARLCKFFIRMVNFLTFLETLGNGVYYVKIYILPKCIRNAAEEKRKGLIYTWYMERKYILTYWAWISMLSVLLDAVLRICSRVRSHKSDATSLH